MQCNLKRVFTAESWSTDLAGLQVNFHRPGFFGALRLVSEEESGVGDGTPMAVAKLE